MDSTPGQQDRITSVVDRVKGILLKPVEEWARIDLETTPIGAIYRNYVLILAAIGPICGFIGSQLFGYGAFGISFRPSLTSALSSAIVQYVLGLVMVYVLALIIDALAPTFNGTRSRDQAFKVAAYSTTASWVAGVFTLIPSLVILAALAGLYSLYLLYLGLPRLMKVAADKAVAYVACVVVAAIVLFIVVGAVTGAVASIFTSFPGMTTTSATTAGTVTVPGMGSLDLDKMQAATKQMEAAANQASAPAGSAGAVTATAPAVLQALLPASVAGLPRTAVESASGGAGGFSGSNAEATYGGNDKHIKLSVTDMGASGALAAMGSAFNVQSSKQDAGGYEKIGQVDGRMTSEKWRSEGKSAEYSVLVGSRFMISADGDGVEMDAVKSAVAGVDAGALEGLAKQATR